MLFLIRTQEDADKAAQIVSTLNLEREWYVVVSWEAPDAEAARERNRAMREENVRLKARIIELEQIK
jgi:hypothetical protein